MDVLIILLALIVTVCAVIIWVCGIWIIVIAFKESVSCGLMFIFIPFYSLYYIITRWSKVKKPFLIQLPALVILIIIMIFFMWGIGVYNNLVTINEEVNQSWSQVENQYQRRTDLIPNLVNTVRGYANFERGVLTDVTEARAKVSQFNITPEVLNDPQAFQKFEQLQGKLSNALSRLLVTVENYPELKANENFLQLQAQLEGSENRISVERRKFNLSVQNYNTTIKRFPAAFFAGIFGFKEKPYFKSIPGSGTPPKVEF